MMTSLHRDSSPPSPHGMGNCMQYRHNNVSISASKDRKMGLSTHVLDTMHGCPAAGMGVSLYTTEGEAATLVKSFNLNDDGRNADGLLIGHADLAVGTYRLVFDVAGYFAAKGVALPTPNFLNRVALDFGIAKPNEHYHVPLLVSPWSYSTYRGS